MRYVCSKEVQYYGGWRFHTHYVDGNHMHFHITSASLKTRILFSPCSLLSLGLSPPTKCSIQSFQVFNVLSSKVDILRVWWQWWSRLREKENFSSRNKFSVSAQIDPQCRVLFYSLLRSRSTVKDEQGKKKTVNFEIELKYWNSVENKRRLWTL